MPGAEKETRLDGNELETAISTLGEGWKVEDNHHLRKDFKFPDFVTALEFVNSIAVIAEEQQHHPDITLTWGKVSLSVWTHTLNGLSAKDIRLAESINGIGSS